MNKRNTVLLIVIFLILIITYNSSTPIAAGGRTPGGIVISNNSASMDFPLALNFSCQIKSNSDIADIRLRYRIEQVSFAQVTSEIKVLFVPGNLVSAKYTLDMLKVGGLPPGSKIDYWWYIRDANGDYLESVPTRYEINDNRYSWRNLSERKINLFWYQGDASFANTLMSSGREALVKLANETGAIPEKKINIYIYASSNDLRGSLIFPSEWTGGIAFLQYNIIAIGINPNNLIWGQGAMVHEITHNVIYQVTNNPYSNIPRWLDEGLAMYAEGLLSPQYTGPLQDAIANDRLITVRSLSSPFSAYADKANLSYAQSFSLVDYLISKYGPNKMLELLDTFKQGSTYDNALQKVYGLDMDSLYTQWKIWIKGLYRK